MKWIVHKFGGTSVASGERYLNVVRIIRARQNSGERLAVIVSAMSGVTDALIKLVELAAARDDSYLEKLETLKQRHLETIDSVLSDQTEVQELARIINADFSDIAEVLRGSQSLGSLRNRSRNLLLVTGRFGPRRSSNAHLSVTVKPASGSTPAKF